MVWILIGLVQNINYLNTGLENTHSKPEDIRQWGDFGVVEGVEIRTVSKTTSCRDNAVLSWWENCLLWGIPHSSNQTLTCGLTAAAVGGTAARLKPGILLIYWIYQKLCFSWGNSPSHSLCQLQPDWWLQGPWDCACMYMWMHIAALPFSRNAFPEIPWGACELAVHDQQCIIAAGFSIGSWLR